MVRKIIILSEEEKKSIELKINAKAADSRLTRKKRIGRCPRCDKFFDRREARKNHHVGKCSIACNPGGMPIFRKTSKEKKRARKLKSLIKKQENRIARSVSTDFYDSREWRELRYKALRKLGFCCFACGRRPPTVILHVDHVKPRSKYPELELSLDNLQVLCADCNIGKSNKFEDDLR